jgi:hypothetical protein
LEVQQPTGSVKLALLADTFGVGLLIVKNDIQGNIQVQSDDQWTSSHLGGRWVVMA